MATGKYQKNDSLAAASVKAKTNEQHVAPIDNTEQDGVNFLEPNLVDSELIIGLVGAAGTKLSKIQGIIKQRLEVSNYTVETIRVSNDIITNITSPNKDVSPDDEFARIDTMMTAGNEARKQAGDNSILALGVASWINSKRNKDNSGNPEPQKRKAYIINSLKHPEEVSKLRAIYPQGFYLIGVYSDPKRRKNYLLEEKRISDEGKVKKIMERDEDEQLSYGQRVRDTFHLSDFFIRIESDEDLLKNSLWRILEILFGHPYRTPAFDEYAMFLAYAASLRSCDLSRQVGAVIAKDNEILATGANDCPKYGGGLYWPEFNKETKIIEDQKNGRDYKRGEDANKVQLQQMENEIIEKAKSEEISADKLKRILDSSQIKDLTEFGRSVHAEMEAILSSLRNNKSVKGATLYCTTFPCHNCAKHIIAAGIKRVVYVEPYQKSKAEELHGDAISLGFPKNSDENGKVVSFEPFVGIGPRRFFDLFSTRLGSGYELIRKNPEGKTLNWKPENATLRLQMLPCAYIELEQEAGDKFITIRERIEGESEKENN